MNQQASPPTPIKKPGITREDVATAFHHGARALTRTAAVAALKKLGFGKSAAYDALLEDGRFAAWLQFAPDGIITWTE
jgi:DNA-binding SARP family transcriptional activator